MRLKTKPVLFVAMLASGIALAFYAYIGSYTRLLADDYCSFYDARRLDVLRYIWYWYITWGGRYSAIATDNLLPYIGLTGLRFVPVTVLAIWLAALFFMFKQLLRKDVSRQIGWAAPAALSFVFLFAILFISPNSQQVIYWWNGMRTYVPALIVVTIHLAFLYGTEDRLHTRRGVWTATLVSFGTAFFSGGYNETFTATQFAFFVGVLVLFLLLGKIRFGDTTFQLLSAAILGSTIAMGIMLISPGAAHRQEFFPQPPGLIDLIRIATQGYLAYLENIFFHLPTFSAIAAITLLTIWIGLQADHGLETGLPVFLCVTGGFALSFISLLPSVYGLSEMPAARTFVVPTYIVLCGFTFGGLALGKWISHTGWSGLSSAWGYFAWALLIVVFLSTAININFIYSKMDSYVKFAKLWDRADALIIQAHENHDKSVTIPAMDNWAGLERPTTSKRYWPNKCFSLYYDIQVFGPDYD